METSQGRADAFNGLVLLNDGNKNFKPVGFETSGFLVPGDARALSLINVGGSGYMVSTENRKPLKIFKLHESSKSDVQLMPSEVTAYLFFSNGKKQKAELTYGTSFLSQKTRTLNTPKGVIKIELYTQQGKLTRTINTP